MNIESTSVGKAMVVKVSGRIDAQTTDQFGAACKLLIQDGATHVVVDLTELQYISSAGLSTILRFAKELQGKGGVLAIAGLKGLVKQVFELTNLIGVFPVYETAEEASRSFCWNKNFGGSNGRRNSTPSRNSSLSFVRARRRQTCLSFSTGTSN